MIAATLMVKIAADTTAFNNALSQAQRAVRGSAAQMEQASTAVTALQTRIRGLNEGFRIGAIAEQQWASAMRTAIADAQQLAATSELTAKSQQRLASVISGAERQLRSAGTAARRSVDGLEGMAVAFNGVALAATQGLAGIQSATSGFQQLAISMKAVTAVGVIGAIGAIASVVMTLVGALKQSEKAADDAAKAMERFSTGRLRGLIEANQARQRAIRQGLASGNVSTVGSLVLDAAEDVGIGRIQRMTTGMNQLAALTLAKLNEQESLLRGAFMVASDRLPVERAITFEIARQSNLAADQVAAMRLLSGQRGATLEMLMRGRAVQPVPLDKATESMFAGIEAAAAAADDAKIDRILGPLRNLRDGALDISNDIANGLTTVAASIAGGFRSIGSAILGVVGGFMVSLGKALIATSIAVKALRNIITNPVAATVAGVALVALGSALSASANRSAQSTFGGGGGSASISSGGGGSFNAGGGESGGTKVIYLVGNQGDVYTYDQIDRLFQQLGDGDARRVQVRRLPRDS